MYVMPITLFGIIFGTMLTGGAVTLIWEHRRKIVGFIRFLLKKSDKFMKWLYSDEKSLSEQISEEFCNAQISFIRTDWRN